MFFNMRLCKLQVIYIELINSSLIDAELTYLVRNLGEIRWLSVLQILTR